MVFCVCLVMDVGEYVWEYGCVGVCVCVCVHGWIGVCVCVCVCVITTDRQTGWCMMLVRYR